MATTRRNSWCRYSGFYSLGDGAGYTEEEFAFMKAMDRYKIAHRRPFPGWHEVLRVVHSLGYRKVEEEGPLPGPPELKPKTKK